MRFVSMSMVVLTIMCFLALYSCDSKDGSTEGRKTRVSSVSQRIANEETSKYLLKWGKFSDQPAHQLIEESCLLRSIDVLLLYYKLSGVAISADSLTCFLPGMRESKNEFELNRNRSLYEQALSDRLRNLEQKVLVVKSTNEIGLLDYDFVTSGYWLVYGIQREFVHEFGYRRFKEMRVRISDSLGWGYVITRNGPQNVPIDVIVNITNLADTNVFVDFLSIDPSCAEIIRNKLRYSDRLDMPTIDAYIVIEPEESRTNQRPVFASDKEIACQATLMVLATTEGEVIAVSPPVAPLATNSRH